MLIYFIFRQDISAATVGLIAQALQQNNTLELLDISYLESKESIKYLASMLKTNVALRGKERENL